MCVLFIQLLVFVAKPRHISTQQYAIDHIAALSALPLHLDLCSTRHATVWRRVSICCDIDTRVRLVIKQLLGNLCRCISMSAAQRLC